MSAHREEAAASDSEAAVESPRDSYIRELKPVRSATELKLPACESEETGKHPLRTSQLSRSAAAVRLIEALVARGVETFFGIPGGPVCPVFEAIRLTRGARLIESRHESHAAFAAALYYRASGKCPAVVVTAGPGVTNAVSGIASASL